MESIYQDLKSDLTDAHSSFLLIEIQEKHTQQILLKHNDYSLEQEAIEIFDRNAKQGTTNVVTVDAEEGVQAQILSIIYSLVGDELKAQKSLDSALKFGIYASTLGLSDLVSDSMTSSITDFISDTVSIVGEKISSAVGDTATNTLFNETESATVQFAEKMNRTSAGKSKLSISSVAQRRLSELADQLSNIQTPHEAMTFTVNLLSALGLDSPKCIIINDPFSLDTASLSLCSLLVSHAKDIKQKGGVLPLSIVFNYTKRQPYEDDEANTLQLNNLLRLRHMAQRYDLLEKPGTRIPTAAIKSTTFVGREEELVRLTALRRELLDHINAQKNTPFHHWTVIEGEPGTGKTALVNQHLASLDNYEDASTSGQIHLRILNQIGHQSKHTGLSSLLSSAEAETTRLTQYYHANTHFFKRTINNKIDDIRSIKEDVSDMVTTRDFSFSKVRKLAKSAISMTNYGTLFSAASSLFDRATMDKSSEQTIEAMMDDGAQSAKMAMFEQLDKVIAELRGVSGAIDDTLLNMPVLLFVDDLQWIDEHSAEYLLTRMIGQYPIQLLLTSRGSDSHSAIKQAAQASNQNRFKLTLFSLCNLCESPDKKVEKILRQDMTLSPKIMIKGMDNRVLTQLIDTVYANPNGIDTKQLSQALISAIQKDKDNEAYINTLLAVETLNLLSDNSFYRRADNLIPLFSKADDGAYFINAPEGSDVEEIIKDTFAHLSKVHVSAFSADRMTGSTGSQFTLASFAVMEERLFIIREYFAEYGDIAAFTLQLSSLFGTPYDSGVVTDVLKLLSELTEEDAPQLLPLVNFIKAQPGDGLSAEHYELLDEVFEIIRRFQGNNLQQYRHGLFKTFLRQQCVFQLKKLLGDTDIDEALSDFYRLLLDVFWMQINEYDPSLVFAPESYERLITLKQSYLEVAKVASEYRQRFEEDYATGLLRLGESFLDTNHLSKAEDMLAQAYSIANTDDNRHLTLLRSTILQRQAKCAHYRNDFDRAVVLLGAALAYDREWHKQSEISFYDTSTTIYMLASARREMAGLLHEMRWNFDAKDELEFCLKHHEKPDEQDASATKKWLEEMAFCHIKLGQILVYDGDDDAAIKHYRSAKEYIDGMAEFDSGKYYKLLGKYIVAVDEDFHVSNAESLISTALSVYKAHYEASPEHHVRPYIEFLNDVIGFYYDKDNGKEARANELYVEARSILEMLHQKSPEAWQSEYLFLLLRHDFPRALPLMEIAYKRNALYFAPHYTILLHNLIEDADAQGDIDKVQCYRKKMADIVDLVLNQDDESIMVTDLPMRPCLGFTPTYQRAIFRLADFYHYYEQYDVAEKLLLAAEDKTERLSNMFGYWGNAQYMMEMKLAKNAELSGHPDKLLRYKLELLDYWYRRYEYFDLPLETFIAKANELIEHFKRGQRHKELLRVLERIADVHLRACCKDVKKHWETCIDALDAVSQQCKKMGDCERGMRIDEGVKRFRQKIKGVMQNHSKETQSILDNNFSLSLWENALEFEIASEEDFDRFFDGSLEDSEEEDEKEEEELDDTIDGIPIDEYFDDEDDIEAWFSGKNNIPSIDGFKEDIATMATDIYKILRFEFGRRLTKEGKEDQFKSYNGFVEEDNFAIYSEQSLLSPMCRDKPDVIELDDFSTSSSTAIQTMTYTLNALAGSSLARGKYVTETLVWIAIITSPDTFEKMFFDIPREPFLELHDVKSIMSRLEEEINFTPGVEATSESPVDLSHIEATLFTSEALMLMSYLFKKTEGNIEVNSSFVHKLAQHCSGDKDYCDMPVTQSVMRLYNYSISNEFEGFE